MSDLASLITVRLQQALTAAITAGTLPANFMPALVAVEPPADPAHGDLASNVALVGAKAAGLNPRVAAEAIVAVLQRDTAFAHVAIAGPGFINLTLAADFLADHLNMLNNGVRFGVPSAAPERVLLDYCGANVAKAMHVGHLRSTVIGECLRRMLAFAGHTVFSDIHTGDWGLQMGMVITEVRRLYPQLPYFNPDYRGTYPSTPPFTVAELEQLYPQAAKRCKEDETSMAEAQQATWELQQGRAGYKALWRHLVDLTLADLKITTDLLGAHFDYWFGESDYQYRVDGLIADLRAMPNLVREDDGALVIDVKEAGDKQDVPPLLLQKSNGGALYATTDLATIEQRAKDLKINRVLYVVDGRQALHFEQVFRAARKSGLAGTMALEHIAFGTVNGADGKPFKTRAGGAFKLSDMTQLAIAEAQKKISAMALGYGLSPEEQDSIAKKVAVAAIKFADLSNTRTANYIFDIEKFTSFEGHTGPYLLYAVVRIKSVLARAAEQGFKPGDITPPTGAEERALMLQLCRFAPSFQAALARRLPHILAQHIYETAQAFSSFYTACHILSAAPAQRAGWLALAQLTERQLVLGLQLLGIEVPERM